MGLVEVFQFLQRKKLLAKFSKKRAKCSIALSSKSRAPPSRWKATCKRTTAMPRKISKTLSNDVVRSLRRTGFRKSPKRFLCFRGFYFGAGSVPFSIEAFTELSCGACGAIYRNQSSEASGFV